MLARNSKIYKLCYFLFKLKFLLSYLGHILSIIHQIVIFQENGLRNLTTKIGILIIVLYLKNA